MKKLSILFLVLSLVLISGSAFAQNDMMTSGEWFIGANYDMGSSLDTDDTNYDAEAGFSITGEYVMPYRDKMSLGGGITYQLPRALEPNADFAAGSEFNFTPVYGLVKYDLEEGAFVVGHLGYNLFNANEEFLDGDTVSGGLYYAAGFGMNLGQFDNESLEDMNVGLMYSVNNGVYDDGTENDVSYSKLSLTFNYNF